MNHPTTSPSGTHVSSLFAKLLSSTFICFARLHGSYRNLPPPSSPRSMYAPVFRFLPRQQGAELVLPPRDHKPLADRRYGPLWSVLHPPHEDVSRVGVDGGEGAGAGHVENVAPPRAHRLEGKRQVESARAGAGELDRERNGFSGVNLSGEKEKDNRAYFVHIYTHVKKLYICKHVAESRRKKKRENDLPGYSRLHSSPRSEWEARSG